MTKSSTAPIGLVFAFGVFAQAAMGQSTNFIDLGGDATGYIAALNFKNSSTQNGIEGKNSDGTFNPNHNGLPDYANFQIPSGFQNAGVWTAIIASPLSAGADYSPISDAFYGGADIGFNNQAVTQADASSLSSGRIDYDNSLISGSGQEFIPVSELSFDFNTFEWDGVVDAEPRSNFQLSNAPINISPLSPVYTEYNDGSGSGNAQLFYQISIDNVTGNGLTFQDGELVSMDFSGDLTIDAFVAPFAGFGSLSYTGTFSASGLGYAFDVAGTDTLAFFSGVNLLANRAGTAAVIPAPGVLAPVSIMAGLAGAARRRRG
ncbi:MAG: hypothetical protein AAGG07_10275 [Planctomycetota bacterium]